MQDRIIGPLTLVQFLYAMSGGIIFYTTLRSGNLLALVFVGIPAGLFFLALAFVKVQEQPFSHFILSLLSFLIKPKREVWHKGMGEPKIVVSKASSSKKKTQVAGKRLSIEEIAKLAKSMDK